MFAFALIFARQIFCLSFVHIAFSVFVLFALLVLCIKFRCIKRFVILLCAFCVGIGYYFGGYFVFRGKEYTEVTVIDARVKSVYVGTGYALYNLDNVKINEHSKSFCISLNVSGDNIISVGSFVNFEAKLSYVELFNKNNSYNSYYYKNNTPYKCSAKLENIKIKDGYLKLNEKVVIGFNNYVAKYVDKDIAGLITGVVFGDKSSLKPEISDAYTKGGIAHLLAVSGMHVMIIITLISFVLDKLKLKTWIKILLLYIPLVFYAYLCNFAPSVVRAITMSFVFSLSSLFGKKYDGLNSLSLSAFLILLVKPLYVFDAGFLLSFACVFCIFTLARPLRKLMFKTKMNKKLASSLALIFAVQLGLIPVMTLFFSSFNIFSFIVNLICVPVFEVAFVLTFVVAILCLFLPFMGFAFKFVQFLYVGVSLFADVVAQISWANIPLTKFNNILVICCYSSIFTISNFVNLQKHKKASLCCFMMALGFLATFLFSVI